MSRIGTDRFAEPDDEAEYFAPVCCICEKNSVEEDGDICDECEKKYAHDFNFARSYLKTRKRQEIGRTSWTDFVLRYIYGINDCENPALVTDLLGCFEEGYTAEQKGKLEVKVEDALAEYILGEKGGEFDEEIKLQNFIV